MRIFVLASCVCALVATRAAAQSPVVLTPNSGISFSASADHSAIDSSGAPRVSSYQLAVLPAAQPAGTPVLVVNLAKPTPDATNTIAVQPIAQLWSLPAGTYIATVAAVAPNGDKSVSLPSDPFVRPGPAAPGKPKITGGGGS